MHTLGEIGIEVDVSWPAVLEPVLATKGMKIKRSDGEHGFESAPCPTATDRVCPVDVNLPLFRTHVNLRPARSV